MSVERISMSGDLEVSLKRFKSFLYRALLLSVERERAYFGAADENGPGRMPHISF
jgi:ribosomal protein S21